MGTFTRLGAPSTNFLSVTPGAMILLERCVVLRAGRAGFTVRAAASSATTATTLAADSRLSVTELAPSVNRGGSTPWPWLETRPRAGSGSGRESPAPVGLLVLAVGRARRGAASQRACFGTIRGRAVKAVSPSVRASSSSPLRPPPACPCLHGPHTSFDYPSRSLDGARGPAAANGWRLDSRLARTERPGTAVGTVKDWGTPACRRSLVWPCGSGP